MKHNSKIFLTVFSLFFAIYALAKDDALDKNNLNLQDEARIGRLLGWQEGLFNDSLCGGRYVEDNEVSFCFNKRSPKASTTKITAKRETIIAEEGESILAGDVAITQTGRMVSANKITFWRDKKNNKIKNINLYGDIKLTEYGKFVVAESGSINLEDRTAMLNDAFYRIKTDTPVNTLHSWGRSRYVFRDRFGVLNLSKASYSTCPPIKPFWRIKADKIILNKETGRGKARKVVFYAKKLPIAYFPYIDFPLDKRRKSGFLYPEIASSSESGFSFALPYYFNLAPNYDFTFTPEFFSLRGFFADSSFRYLTDRHYGSLRVGFIPHDTYFAKFKESEIKQNIPGHNNALSRLENSSVARGLFSFSDRANWYPGLYSDLKINLVSDDYFLQDFRKVPNAIGVDQLLNQADLSYRTDHWYFLARLQAFQTLHPVTYLGAQDQYMRLPQLNLGARYPKQFFGLDCNFESQFVHFEHKDDFESGAPFTKGERIFLTPSISLPVRVQSAYFIPRLDLTSSHYFLKDQPLGSSGSEGQVVPQLSFDSGVFFQGNTSFFGKHYEQTLEPRLYYLFVPKREQDRFPIFDTTLPAFSFESLFRANRFSGQDRIGDANQVTLALTTRFLDDYTGEERMNASLAQVFLFRKHEVCLNGDCSLDPLAKNKLSPLVARLQYAISNSWNTSTDFAYDLSRNLVDAGNLSLQYHSDNNRVVNLSYNFVRGGDAFENEAQKEIKDLDRIEFSLAWPIRKGWHVLGDISYNLSYIHPQKYFYGLEYENCCFALRLIAGQTFKGMNVGGDLIFDKRIYFQFLFKGLGTVGASGANQLLSRNIANYQDNFVVR